MAMVSSMGTPALSSSPMVCSERLMYSARNMRRINGAEILKRSHQLPPTSVRMNARKPPMPMNAANSSNHHHSTMKLESVIRKRVGPGSASSLPLNTPAKLGSTNVSKNTVVDTAMVAMMPG